MGLQLPQDLLAERRRQAKKNPILRIRLALEPTEGQKRARSSNRSRNMPHLTQRELARMFNCNVSTIQKCETNENWPLQRSLKIAFKKQYWKLFGDDEYVGVHKELLFDDFEEKPVWA